jgi:hypothetical protein
MHTESRVTNTGFRLSLRASRLALLTSFLRDETATTALEYVIATLVVALAAVTASRAIAGALIGYLHRIYLVTTLPIP